MKIKRFFVKFLWILWFAFASGKFQSAIVPYAIKSMIDEHFAKLSASHPGNVDIVCIGDETKEFSVLMDLLVKLKIVNVNIKIKKIKSSDKNCQNGGKRLKLDESSILFFDSKNRFKDCLSNIGWIENREERRQQLVYVPALSTSDISRAFPGMNGFVIDQVSFLMNEDKNSIELVSGFMFTAQACRQLQLKPINRFDTNAGKWENSIFYPKKYRNFHDCGILTSEGESLNHEHSKLYDMIFKNVLNAEVYHFAVTPDKCKECELTLESALHDLLKHGNWTKADPHLYITHNFAVPAGEPYTDLERMFMMFSVELWIAIGVTLLIGILVTLSLNFVSAKVKIFIAGRDIQSPTMNLVSIFLTGGQVRTPGRNFARFLFTLFSVWSLIIRTCHQSMLFELMQADLRRPPIRTHDELFKSDLILHESVGWEESAAYDDEYFRQQMAMSSTRLKLVYDVESEDDESLTYFDVISEPSNRACRMAYSNIIRRINTDEYRSGKASLVLLDEDYITLPMALLFKDYSPYLKTYNEMLGWMESNGLMEQWRQKYFEYSSVRETENIGPQILTMDHLKVGFLACLIPINLCIVAFIGEILWPKISKAIRKYVYKAIMKK